VKGLSRGQRVLFRGRVTVKGVTNDWSEPVELLVL
jgi:hypothetical protein